MLKAHEVRGILENRQTQLRRALKVQPPLNTDRFFENEICGKSSSYREFEGLQLNGMGLGHTCFVRCPYGEPGDLLWVRETWEVCPQGCGAGKDSFHIRYRADGGMVFHDLDEGNERANYLTRVYDTRPENLPSIQMPRWASRIQLEIISVRVERLQEISETDAEAEGCYSHSQRSFPRLAPGFRDDFKRIWQEEYGKPISPRKQLSSGKQHRPESWHANPWVWVVEFKRVEA
ncbi:hypothetical protein LB513_02085 [Mesorhizobium sp. ES1-1]|nr:hypothetical protein [Mesorhizobium sp. ES1-1]